MKIYITLFLFLSMSFGLAKPSLDWNAAAKQIVGKWTIVKITSTKNEQNADKVPQIKGLIIFRADGTTRMEGATKEEGHHATESRYTIGDGFIAFYDPKDSDSGQISGYKFRVNNDRLELDIFGPPHLTLHLKKVVEQVVAPDR